MVAKIAPLQTDLALKLLDRFKVFEAVTGATTIEACAHEIEIEYRQEQAHFEQQLSAIKDQQVKKRERWIKRRIEQNQLRTLEVTTMMRPTALDDTADIEFRLKRLQAERLELEKELNAVGADNAGKLPMIAARPASDGDRADDAAAET